MISFYSKIIDPFSNKNFINQNFLIRLFVKIFSYFCFFLVYVIFKFLNLRFISSPLEALGHQAIDLECFMYEYRKTKYKIIILYHDKFIANKFLFKYQKKKFKNFLIIKNLFLCTLLYYTKRKFRDYLSINTQNYLSNKSIDSDKILKILFKKKKINYRIDFDDKQKAIKILNKIGIYNKLNNKIACIHIRDKIFKAFDEENFRTSNFSSFEKSIRYLVLNNYSVFRLGILSDDKKKISIDNFYDLTKYKLSRDENEILTVYLMSESKLFIGSCSGVIDLATIFNIPCLSTNHAPLNHMFSHGNKKICLPKLYKSIRNKKIMSFNSIIKNNYDDLRLDRHFKAHDIRLINNSSLEIYLGLRELLLCIKKKNFGPTKNQLKFRQLFKKNAFSIHSSNQISNKFLLRHKYLLNK